MAVLNKDEIRNRLNNIKLPADEKLVVTPLLDSDRQINTSGIDLRLSNQFIVFRPENISNFDVKELSKPTIRKFQKHIVIPFFKDFILHPHTLVLASTLEFISIPLDTWGLLEGRSSWARLGLIIATASAIDPGYKGCITLELSNLGDLPIHLYPGLRIGQLILNKTEKQNVYDKKNRKYFASIGPEFSKIHEDPDVKIFCVQRS